MNMKSNALVCENYLSLLYQGAKSNHAIQSATETYGEILFPSVMKLISEVNMTNQDVFYDLGSGLGRLALQVFLQSDVKEVCGIELIPELHQQALQAAQKLKLQLPEFFANDRKLIFLQGDLFKMSMNDATIVLICSICFSPAMMQQIGALIERNPKIRTVITLRPIDNLQRLRFKKAFPLEGSWDSTLCYLYQFV